VDVTDASLGHGAGDNHCSCFFLFQFFLKFCCARDGASRDLAGEKNLFKNRKRERELREAVNLFQRFGINIKKTERKKPKKE